MNLWERLLLWIGDLLYGSPSQRATEIGNQLVADLRKGITSQEPLELSDAFLDQCYRSAAIFYVGEDKQP